MTVTVTGVVKNVAGVPDRSKWVFTSLLRESGDVDNSIVSTNLVVATPNTEGLLTVELDPGPVIVRYGNTAVTVTVPDTDIGLWDLIGAAIAVPPNTTAAALAAAIAAYFEANPVEGGVGGVPDDGSVTFAKLAGPLVVTSTETIAANNNNTTVPTSAAVQAAITAAVTALLNGAPGALDTLKELADAINDDASFAATITTALDGKQPLDADLTALAALTAPATKLSGIATGATANSPDATLLARANHTGTQAPATVAFANTARLLGRATAGAGTGEEITLGTNLSLSGTTLNATGGSGGGDASTNTSSSVDSEIAVFSGTGGKTVKRATTTGILKGASGVIGAATAGTDYYAPGGTDIPITDGGTGVSTLPSGLLKGAGTGAITAATAGTDYVAPGGALGTPSSGALTSCTGLPVSGIAASTSTALGVGSIEVGHASDTTITRSEAGLIAVEGVVVPTITGAKRIAVVSSIPGSPDANTVYIVNDAGAPRVATITSSATPAINTDNADQADLLTLTNNVTGFTFSGTPRHGQKLILVIKSASIQTIAGGSSIQNGPASMITATVAGKYHEIGLKYNLAITKWVVMAADAVGY